MANEPSSDDFKAEVKEDLLGLHKAASNYLELHQGVWPQAPKDVNDNTDGSAYEVWIMGVLKQHGAQDKHFKHSADKSDYRMSYSPTYFAEETMVAYRWRAQPWFIPHFMGIESVIVVLPEGKVHTTKPLSQMKEVESKFGGRSYVDPELEGPCPVDSVPAKLRPLFETASKSWKDKP